MCIRLLFNILLFYSVMIKCVLNGHIFSFFAIKLQHHASIQAICFILFMYKFLILYESM